MTKQIVLLLSFLLLAIGLAGRGDAEPCQPADLMPRARDYTSMWWVDGFPGTVADASWRRCIQTGYFAFVLNTETLKIPHLGPIAPGTDYTTATNNATAGKIRDPVWQVLGPAELELVLQVDGKTFRCAGGGKWSRYAGPRLVESGRFVQRADITELPFVSAEGEVLHAEARFETVAWPDRLALILAVRPGARPSQPRQEPSSRARSGSRRGSERIPRDQWKAAAMEITLRSERGELKRRREFSAGDDESNQQWHEVALAFDPTSFRAESTTSPVLVRAHEMPRDRVRPVGYDAIRGWHRVDLNGIEPILPSDISDNRVRQNDAIERIKLVLTNPEDDEQVARLLFAKTSGGFEQDIGSAITGISAMLCDADGSPTGIPVQLSKNWHTRREGGVYSGAWFHGFSQVRLPAGATVELELTLSYGHWGGVPAASHAQLSLIGWGSNQHWSQSAIGAWGESICYEPEQQQANCTITDVRPVMVTIGRDGPQWRWTGNVGGGDFFRCFDPSGNRVPHAAMKTIYHRQGPCLTEVSFAGKLGPGIKHCSTVSLARTDDIVRGIYRIRMHVNEATDFSRFVIFQIGADTYSYTRERKIAVGNESGLIKEWNSQWGGDAYRTQPWQASGRIPWASLHEAVRPENSKPRAWANRGIIIRQWKARLGGKPASPWLAERGVDRGSNDSSTLDVLPPPGLARLEPGDFVEATFEHIVMPQYAADYYGPNEALRDALMQNENTWRMIAREAMGNDRRVEMIKGTVEQVYPDVRVGTDGDRSTYKLTGGLAYVPVTFTGLRSHQGYVLTINGGALDQSIHGNDFWQMDYDPVTQRWSRTYNIPVVGGEVQTVSFRPQVVVKPQRPPSR